MMEPTQTKSVVQNVDGSNNGKTQAASFTEDLDLVRRTRQGDIGAFEELFNRHQKRVYNIVYRIMRDEQEAADVTQEVFVKVYKSIDKLKADEAFFTWLRMVAVNLCRDRIRRRPPMRIESLDEKIETDGGAVDREIADWSNNPQKTFEKKDLQGAVHKALSTLSDDHRTVVVLHHLEGMDVQDMSRVLGCPPGTVKSRLARAREELKRKLGGYVDVE